MKLPSHISTPSSSTLHNAVSKPSLKSIAPLAVAVASMSPMVLVGGVVAKEAVQHKSEIKSTLGVIGQDAKKAGTVIAADTKKAGTVIAKDTGKVAHAAASGMQNMMIIGGIGLVGLILLKSML